MARFPRIPPMRRVGPGLHEITVRLPERSRVEYRLVVTSNGGSHEFDDPHNPRRATDPFGSHSVAYGPHYPEAWWTQPSLNGGELRRGFVESQAYGQRRFVRWYHPAGGGTNLPLLVVHDGSDFVQHAGLVEVLDNLIAAAALPPLVVALVDSGDRLAEYTDDPRHSWYIAEVVSSAVRRHGVDPDPGAHVYLGASLGAVGALAAAWRTRPIAGLVLLSGSFVTALGGPMQRSARFLPVIDFVERFSTGSGRPAGKMYQACGSYEGLAPDNRAFRAVLEATGTDLVFEEVPDGHHWHNWRDRLATALTHTLPGADPAAVGTVPP